MSLKIDLSDNLSQMEQLFLELSTNTIKKTSVQTMNRSIKKARTLTSGLIRKEIAMKKGKLDNGFIKITNANKFRMEASLKIKYGPISLIRFVVNKPSNKKGQSRKTHLRVRVKPGRAKVSKTLFIATGKNNNRHVFRSNSQGKLYKQSAPSASKIFDKPHVGGTVKKIIPGFYEKEFLRRLNVKLQKKRMRQGGL